MQLEAIGDYEFETGERYPEGVGLRAVGKSNNVRGGGAKRKQEPIFAQEAKTKVEEIQGLEWPERGAEGELRSLKLQASRWRPSKGGRPAGLDAAVKAVSALYPTAPVPYGCDEKSLHRVVELGCDGFSDEAVAEACQILGLDFIIEKPVGEGRVSWSAVDKAWSFEF